MAAEAIVSGGPARPYHNTESQGITFRDVLLHLLSLQRKVVRSRQNLDVSSMRQTLKIHRTVRSAVADRVS